VNFSHRCRIDCQAKCVEYAHWEGQKPGISCDIENYGDKRTVFMPGIEFPVVILFGEG